jgi:hypothetical protein
MADHVPKIELKRRQKKNERPFHLLYEATVTAMFATQKHCYIVAAPREVARCG